MQKILILLCLCIICNNFSDNSDNYSMILRSFWNYYRDQVSDSTNKNNDANNCRVNNNKTTTVNFLTRRQK